jgi:hypothetical protein
LGTWEFFSWASTNFASSYDIFCLASLLAENYYGSTTGYKGTFFSEGLAGVCLAFEFLASDPSYLRWFEISLVQDSLNKTFL